MKILVTGGAGFIGSHVVELLLQHGHEPIIVDNLSTGNKEIVPPQVRIIEMDMNSPQIEGVFARENPDVVIHLAAQVDVATSIQNPVYDAEQNILGTIRLLNYCQKYNVQKVVFSSTCAVYGETADCSITESFPVNPLSFYGLSKYTSERYIQLFYNFNKVPFTILRYANVYGPRQTSKGEGGVISTFFGKILNGEAPFIYGNGEQTRDFVYVKDIALANVLAINKGENEIFNIGCNTKTSVNELLKMMTSLASVQISPIIKPARDGDIQHSQLDNTKATTSLGWQPSYELLTGLSDTFNYYNEVNEGQKKDLLDRKNAGKGSAFVMEEFWAIIAKNKGTVSSKDLQEYKLIGKGADGSVFQLTADRCVKIFGNEQTKALELNALQVGQSSPVIPRLYEDGPNYIIMEYVQGISLPQFLKKEKQLPEPIVEKILAMLVELKKVGFERLDTEVRHILFNEDMDIRVIDLKRAFGSVRTNPTKLLKGIKKKGYLEEFLKHVNTIDPALYKEWKNIID